MQTYSQTLAEPSSFVSWPLLPPPRFMVVISNVGWPWILGDEEGVVLGVRAPSKRVADPRLGADGMREGG